jgi:dTDP-4-amino-4,6-dideoxygalactose transaminase
MVDPTPQATQATREVLSLPVHPHLDVADLDRIAHAVKAALS